jgi:hypothetical protein
MLDRIVEVFCEVDDFCQAFLPQWEASLLGLTTRFVRSCSRAEQAANIATHCPPNRPLTVIVGCVREA